MNHFQASLNFPIEPQSLSSFSIQASHYPLNLSLQKRAIPHLNPLYMPILSQPGNPPEPTKRIRHTEQDYTETSFKAEDVPSKFQYADLLRNSQHHYRDMRSLYLAQQLINNKENARNNGMASVQAFSLSTADSKIPNLDSDVLIPPFNNSITEQSGSPFASRAYGAFVKDTQRLQYEAQQKLVQQLLRQKEEYVLQQEVLQQIEKQQHELEVFMQQQLAQQTQFKIGQLNQNMSLRDINAHHQLNMLKLVTCEESRDFEVNSLKSDNFKLELLSFGEKSEKVSSSSCEVEIPELKVEEDYKLYKTQDSSCGSRKDSPFKEKVKALKEKVVKPRRKRSQHYPSDYFGILGKNLPGKVGEEPRRKNKWQKMLQALRPDIVCEEEQTGAKPKDLEVREEKIQDVRPAKAGKPVELPQHMQDDSLINYDHLIKVTITNDPASLGDDKTNPDFVVINKEIKERTMDEEVEKTRVGDRYQAVVPAYEEKDTRTTRRHPEMVWGPGTIRENELRRYFAELCRMLKCEMINEDRALKLLRRKRYKKDKVLINISKNEKFYASYLIVSNIVDLNTDDVP